VLIEKSTLAQQLKASKRTGITKATTLCVHGLQRLWWLTSLKEKEERLLHYFCRGYGQKMVWQRWPAIQPFGIDQRLYGLRGVFAAGESEKALRFLKYFSRRRLLGEHVPYAVEAYPEGNQRHLSAESGLYCRIYTEGVFGMRPKGFNSFMLVCRRNGIKWL
jgi:hypothetical protein